jgi:hypothetical protein
MYYCVYTAKSLRETSSVLRYTYIVYLIIQYITNTDYRISGLCLNITSESKLLIPNNLVYLRNYY